MSGRFAGQRRVRVGAAVAAVLLGVGMVAGCGGQSAEPEPKDWSEGKDQRKDGQQQAGSGKPDKPAEPEEYTFVKEYIAAISEVSAGEDSSKLLEMSTDDCEGCDYMAQHHQDVYDAGGKYVGDPSWEPVALVDGPEGQAPTVLRVRWKQDPDLKIITEKGGGEKPIGPPEQMSDFELVREGKSWKVSEFCGVTEGQPSGCPDL